jgi:anti-sigma regulatory factor (Ser/Thr protein kinase)
MEPAPRLDSAGAFPLRLCVRRMPLPDAAAPAARVTLRLPSDITCVEEAVSLVTRHCLAGVQATPRVRFRLQVALAEALANAILRGNCEDCDKTVLVTAELYADTIRLSVTDEGPGFDPRTIPDAIRPERLEETCGRGLFLIRKLVDSVQFNERGNSICMTLRRR